MDALVAAIIAGTISAVISGIILLVVTNASKAASDDAARANLAEKRLVQKDLEELTRKFAAQEKNQVETNKVVQQVREKLIELSTKHDHFHDRLFEVIKTVEKLQSSAEGFGNVILK